MSPRRWWSGGRQRTAADTDPSGDGTRAPLAVPGFPLLPDAPSPGRGAASGPPGAASGRPGGGADADEPDLSDIGRRIAAEVVEAAAGGRTGVLHLVGDPGGLVYLSAGRVLHVETWTTPGVEILLLRRALDHTGWRQVITGIGTRPGRETATEQARELLRRGALTPIEVDVAEQRAVADAGAALLAADDATLVRSRFFRNEQPWIGLSEPLTVRALLAEAARRRRVLARIGGVALAEAPLTRVPRLPRSSVRITAAQWNLITLVDGRHTPRHLAWLVGREVFATVGEAARLVRLGLIEPGPTGPGPTGPGPTGPADRTGGGPSGGDSGRTNPIPLPISAPVPGGTPIPGGEHDG